MIRNTNILQIGLGFLLLLKTIKDKETTHSQEERELFL